MATNYGNNFVAFNNIDAVFSKEYVSEFKAPVIAGDNHDERTFDSVWQYELYNKAVLACDADAMRFARGRTAKSGLNKLDQKLVDEMNAEQLTAWSQIENQVLSEGNHAKFSQNSKLRRDLLATNGKELILGDASDKVNGAGIWTNQISDKNHGNGQNAYGQMLMDVRDTIEREVSEAKRLANDPKAKQAEIVGKAEPFIVNGQIVGKKIRNTIGFNNNDKNVPFSNDYWSPKGYTFYYLNPARVSAQPFPGGQPVTVHSVNQGLAFMQAVDAQDLNRASEIGSEILPKHFTVSRKNAPHDWPIYEDMIMKQLMIAKFSDPSMKPYLDATKGYKLVNASFKDKLYGIGTDLDHNFTFGKGKNKQGEALVGAREEIIGVEGDYMAETAKQDEKVNSSKTHGDLRMVRNGVIFQQVNCAGKMGADLAGSLGRYYSPDGKIKSSPIYQQYMNMYNQTNDPNAYKSANYDTQVKPGLLGKMQTIDLGNGTTLINSFSQADLGREGKFTDETALLQNIEKAATFAEKQGKKLYLPENVGVGLGGGDKKLIENGIKQTIQGHPGVVYKVAWEKGVNPDPEMSDEVQSVKSPYREKTQVKQQSSNYQQNSNNQQNNNYQQNNYQNNGSQQQPKGKQPYKMAIIGHTPGDLFNKVAANDKKNGTKKMWACMPKKMFAGNYKQDYFSTMVTDYEQALIEKRLKEHDHVEVQTDLAQGVGMIGARAALGEKEKHRERQDGKQVSICAHLAGGFGQFKNMSPEGKEYAKLMLSQCDSAVITENGKTQKLDHKQLNERLHNFDQEVETSNFSSKDYFIRDQNMLKATHELSTVYDGSWEKVNSKGETETYRSTGNPKHSNTGRRIAMFQSGSVKNPPVTIPSKGMQQFKAPAGKKIINVDPVGMNSLAVQGFRKAEAAHQALGDKMAIRKAAYNDFFNATTFAGEDVTKGRYGINIENKGYRDKVLESLSRPLPDVASNAQQPQAPGKVDPVSELPGMGSVVSTQSTSAQSVPDIPDMVSESDASQLTPVKTLTKEEVKKESPKPEKKAPTVPKPVSIPDAVESSAVDLPDDMPDLPDDVLGSVTEDLSDEKPVQQQKKRRQQRQTRLEETQVDLSSAKASEKPMYHETESFVENETKKDPSIKKDKSKQTKLKLQASEVDKNAKETNVAKKAAEKDAQQAANQTETMVKKNEPSLEN